MKKNKKESVKHPATYTDVFIPVFAEYLQNYSSVYDPFAGTGKIALIRDHGYSGKIYCGEIEPEWTSQYSGIDHWFIGDSAKTCFIQNKFFDAICTSPTYGNRMADHYEAKDSSKRITYRHLIGRKLDDRNTGKMQWGKSYKDKHIDVYKELFRLLKDNGIFILNVSDHIRSGEVIEVSRWHKETLENIGFCLEKELSIPTKRMGFGANNKARVENENIFIFKKLR